jgi:hypothetical protein
MSVKMRGGVGYGEPLAMTSSAQCTWPGYGRVLVHNYGCCMESVLPRICIGCACRRTALYTLWHGCSLFLRCPGPLVALLLVPQLLVSHVDFGTMIGKLNSDTATGNSCCIDQFEQCEATTSMHSNMPLYHTHLTW